MLSLEASNGRSEQGTLVQLGLSRAIMRVLLHRSRLGEP
jgi:hypothetical protein